MGILLPDICSDGLLQCFKQEKMGLLRRNSDDFEVHESHVHLHLPRHSHFIDLGPTLSDRYPDLNKGDSVDL